MIEEYIYQVNCFSKIRPKTILEIGALDGDYSRRIQRKFKVQESGIILVEPNPESFIKLSRSFPKSKLFNYAVSKGNGTETLRKVLSKKRDDIGCSSLLSRDDGWGKSLTFEMINVNSITGQSLLEKIDKNVDMCILDVEGLAFEVLESFGNRLSDLKSLMVECEHKKIFENQSLYNDVSNILLRNNFVQMAFRYSYSNQSDSVWIHEDFIDLSRGTPNYTSRFHSITSRLKLK